MHPTINGVGTTPIINILAIPSRRIHPSITPRQYQLVTICCVIYRLFHETSPFSCHYPHIHALYYYRFDSSATSPPLRSILTIPFNIRCILGSTEPLNTHPVNLRGISIIPPHTVQKHSATTEKRPLLSPGAAHDCRGCVLRRGRLRRGAAAALNGGSS